MARAGTQRWKNPAPEGDDVQRSIELLDKVLSEYDEHGGDEAAAEEGSSALGVGEVVDDVEVRHDSSTEPSIGLTPDEESPSLGHQSEDDGYMSMNGRKAKMALVALRPLPDCPEPQESNPPHEFPPPPEEAERIISTLLPIVSPKNSFKKKSSRSGRCIDKQSDDSARPRHRGYAPVTSQTTLPKTRRRKLYGLWDRASNASLETPGRNSTSSKFSSLPYDVQVSCDWILEVKNTDKPGEKHRDIGGRRRRVRSTHLESESAISQSANEANSAIIPDPQFYIEDIRVIEPDEFKNVEKNPVHEDDELDDDELDDEDEQRSDDADDDSRIDRNHSDSSCDGRFSRRRRRKRKTGMGRGVSESESERYSIPRSNSVSVERFSMHANCDSSDFSRANSTSNEQFHSDFSLAVASASSNDHVSIPTSDPFSVRNLDFAVSAFSLGRADSCSERFSDVYSTRNSDFSTRNSTDFRTQSEEERFSDDSLEEMLGSAVPQPPPMPPSPPAEPVVDKRHSIAWEVSLEEDPLYTPGSTKVVGRRRRRSSDVSSVGSASKLRDLDYDWQEPHRQSTTDDDLISPYSADSSTNELDELTTSVKQDYAIATKNGTYVIRGRTRKKERKSLMGAVDSTFDATNVIKRYSNTFDDIKSLWREGRLEGLNEPPPDFVPPVPPDLVRVLSLPAFDEIDGTKISSNSTTVVPRHEKNHYLSQSSSSSSSSPPPPPPPAPTSSVEKTHGLFKSKCNGINARGVLSTSKSFDVNASSRCQSENNGVSVISVKTQGKKHENRSNLSKIPVNVLIEDQIVKKALNENRRQLEKVSDAIKELENARNSESLTADVKKRIKENSKNKSLRNEVESDVDNSYDVSRDDEECHQACSSDYELRKKPNDAINDVIYTSSRRIVENDTDNLTKNDQRQIENVIDAILEDSKNPEFQVSVEVLEFPPLPPSPVEEADEEATDIANVAPVTVSTHYGSHRTSTRQSSRTIEYRPRVPPHRVSAIDGKDVHKASLDTTRSMDAGYSRGRRTPTASNSRRDVPAERRTLPTDLPGPSRRRTSARQSPSTDNAMGTPIMGTVTTPGNSGMQTSCSLPETPVFARGSDMPRTPQHTSGNTLSTTTTTASTGATQLRRQPGWYAPTTATTGGYRRNNPGLEQAIIGTELLRLAGGPNRGWYPTRRATNQPRPASIEHLERLNTFELRLPTSGEQRKPLTLPTNITPNKYFAQSKHSSATSGTREALRRVTSLLIKKGNSKESKGPAKDVFSSGPYSGGEPSDAPKKKGFFKNFWKRSRHYSLENQ